MLLYPAPPPGPPPPRPPANVSSRCRVFQKTSLFLFFFFSTSIYYFSHIFHVVLVNACAGSQLRVSVEVPIGDSRAKRAVRDMASDDSELRIESTVQTKINKKVAMNALVSENLFFKGIGATRVEFFFFFSYYWSRCGRSPARGNGRIVPKKMLCAILWRSTGPQPGTTIGTIFRTLMHYFARVSASFS